MYIFLSPHFDDAIGSAGGVIGRLVNSGKKCCVMTFMTRVPWFKFKWASYVLQRHLENLQACRILNCKIKNAPFFDAPYRKEIRETLKGSKKPLFTLEVTEYGLVNEIRNYILKNTTPDDILIAPATLGNHIDHRIVNLAVQNLNRQVYFYEEFFYDKNDRYNINDKENPLTADYEYVFLTEEEIEKKVRSMLKYKRTLRKLFRHNWMKRINTYFKEERLFQNKAYERFNKTHFLHEK